MDSNKLKQLIQEEIQKALSEATPQGVFDTKDIEEAQPRDYDFIGDGLVHLWNAGVKKGINRKAMATYMMNWAKAALRDIE